MEKKPLQCQSKSLRKNVNKHEIRVFIRSCETQWEEATRWIAVRNSQSYSATSLNTWLRLRRFGNFPAAPASCSSQAAFRTQPCTPKNLIRFVAVLTSTWQFTLWSFLTHWRNLTTEVGLRNGATISHHQKCIAILFFSLKLVIQNM